MHVKLGGFVTGSQSYVWTYAQLPGGAGGAIRLAVRNYLMTGNSEENVPIVSVRLCESP